MNLLPKLVVIFSMLSFSFSFAQEHIELKYTAQTRGYFLKIEVKNQVLMITENGYTFSQTLSNSNNQKLLLKLSKIDFDNLTVENNKKDYEVDKAIPANFYLKTETEEYNFELTHNNNDEINCIVMFLQSFSKE
jgi:hypothetical protein